MLDANSELNLLGTEFFLNGDEITNFVLGQSFVIDDRGGAAL